MPAIIAKRRRQPNPLSRKRSRRNRQDSTSQNRTPLLTPSLRRRLNALCLPCTEDLLNPTSKPPPSQDGSQLPSRLPSQCELEGNTAPAAVSSQEDLRVRELQACTEIVHHDAEASVDLGPFRSSQMSEGLAAVLGSRIPDDRGRAGGKRVWRSLMDELEGAATSQDVE